MRPVGKDKTQKGAIHWWGSLQTTIYKASIPHITLWRDMKRESKKMYIPTTLQIQFVKSIAYFN